MGQYKIIFDGVLITLDNLSRICVKSGMGLTTVLEASNNTIMISTIPKLS